jgi:hypothetical protein
MFSFYDVKDLTCFLQKIFTQKAEPSDYWYRYCAKVFYEIGYDI